MVNSLMFGTKIGRLLKNSGKKERIQFWFASMVTVTATLLYTMFAFGLSDITNDSLSKNDVQQLQGVLSSVILISKLQLCFFNGYWQHSCKIYLILENTLQKHYY